MTPDPVITALIYPVTSRQSNIHKNQSWAVYSEKRDKFINQLQSKFINNNGAKHLEDCNDIAEESNPIQVYVFYAVCHLGFKKSVTTNRPSLDFTCLTRPSNSTMQATQNLKQLPDMWYFHGSSSQRTTWTWKQIQNTVAVNKKASKFLLTLFNDLLIVI